jgi:proton-translocating NADH-quinone oxidoreductase, chain L
MISFLPAASSAVEYAEVAPASGAASFAWLLFVIPAVAAALLLLGGKRTDKWGHWLAVLASWCSFGLGVAILLQLLGMPSGERRMNVDMFAWIPAGDFQVNFGLLIDPLSVTFVMLVTLVGSLILVYSVGYMEHDVARRRFFAYLALFIASMLILVLGNSYATLFLGWEGVGLCSYLLIGFWNQIPENATAAKKAFIMNRVGDIGLLAAMMGMVAAFSSVDFQVVNAGIADAAPGVATTIGLFLLLAACGKSAQYPLQAWLGDAMAGPTPVSALIHAATMVTAGVYLIVRSGIIFVAAPIAMTAVAIVGLITLLLGAIIGCAKDDIKKALAASTMSQVGYMMLGAGLGPIGWAFAIFHLLTHGFFKSLMFLGAGSVMHGLGEQTNMRRYGALRKVMGVTWITFMAGWLAILGIFPFSGYWSKDRIIEAAFAAGNFGTLDTPWLGWVYGPITMIAAAITAFYMSRVFFMTFFGKARWAAADGEPLQPHESKPVMTIPLIILAIFAVALGGVLSIGDTFINWLTPAVGETHHAEPVVAVYVIQILTLALVILAAIVAWLMYGKNEVSVSQPAGSKFTQAARADFYQDQFNEAVFMAPSVAVMKGVTEVDKHGIDGAVNGIGWLAKWSGKILARTESGYERAYAGYILGGVVLVLAIALGIRL